MSKSFLSTEQLDHAAHNLFRHETGFDREGWQLLTEVERQQWRDRALAKLGDYAVMGETERRRLYAETLTAVLNRETE